VKIFIEEGLLMYFMFPCIEPILSKNGKSL
jgi:hypothetical protein